MEDKLKIISRTIKMKDLAVPGREFITDSDSLEAQLQIVSPASMQRLDYHMIVCNDVLIFAHSKKRSTFGRRNSSKDTICVTFRDLHVLAGDQDSIVELDCVPPSAQVPGEVVTTTTRFMGDRYKLRMFCDSPKAANSVRQAIADAVGKFETVNCEPQESTPAASGPPAVPTRSRSFRRIAKEVQYKNSVKSAFESSAGTAVDAAQENCQKAAPAVPLRTSRTLHHPQEEQKVEEGEASRAAPVTPPVHSFRSFSLGQVGSSVEGIQFGAYGEQVQSLSGLFGRLADLSAEVRGGTGTQVVEVLREVIMTEARYVDDLRVLVEMYMQPLEHQAREAASSLESGEEDSIRGSQEAIMSLSEIQAVFNFIVPIAKVNSELLQRIHSQLLSISDSFTEAGEHNPVTWIVAISQVYAKEFCHIVPFFKMYSTYCHQYTGALGRLSMLRARSKGLQMFLEEIESRQENQQYSLSTLLIKPVQRICKYPLLFRELLKHTEKLDLQDSQVGCIQELEAAKVMVEEIAATVNTKVTERENQDKVLEIFNELVGDQCADLVSPSRRIEYVAEVDISEQPYTEKRAGKMYVFNDLVIIAKYQGNAGLALVNNALGKTRRQQLKVLGYESLTGRCKLNFMSQYDDEKSGKVCLRFTKSACRFWLWCSSTTEAQGLAGSFENVKNEIQSREDSKWEKKTNTRSWTRSLRRSRTGAVDTEAPTADPPVQRTLDNSGAVGQADQAVADEPESAGTAEQTVEEGPTPRSQRASKRASHRGTLSLEQLRSRYEVARPPPLPENGLLEFTVTFPEGPLGIALENGAECPGVLVSLISRSSVAEKSGVHVGDRVTKVGQVEVSFSDTWSSVVQVIKSTPRPFEVNFERTPSTIAFGEKKLKFESLMTKLSYGLQAADEVTSDRGESLAEVKDEALQRIDQVLNPLKELALSSNMTEPERDQIGIRLVTLLRELFLTEFEHVDAMRDLVSGYLLPIRQYRLQNNTEKGAFNPNTIGSPNRRGTRIPSLSEEDESTIFLNIDMLFKTNSELFKLWNESILNGDEAPSIQLLVKTLAHGFCQVVPFLVKAHCYYCSRYTLALDTITKLRQCDSDFDAFVADKEASLVAGDLFPMVMMKPVHRVSRYFNLFAMIGDALQEWRGDEGKPSLKKECMEANKAAFALAQDCNHQIEEKIVTAENLERTNEIYRNLGGEEGASSITDLLGPNTVYIRTEEVELQVAPFADDNPAFGCRMHVFENVILLTRARSAPGSKVSNGTGTFGRLSFKKGTSKARANRAKLESASATHVLLNRLELARCTLRELPTQIRKELPTATGAVNLQSRYGFELKHVKRVSAQEQASSSRSWLGRRGSSGSGSTKVATVVEKFHIRVRNEATAKTLISAIGSLIVDQAAKSAGGSSGNRGVRSWKKRTMSRTALAKAPGIPDEEEEGESKTASNSA